MSATATLEAPARAKSMFRLSSLWKKYLMAVSGLVLVGFVGGHLLGNLQVYPLLGGQEAFNAYAYKLHNLPYGLLYVVRAFLLATVAVHIWTAILLTLENRAARPTGYTDNKVVQASYSARTMRWSGIILLAFIIFHLAHFTVRNVPGMEYNETIAKTELLKGGKPVLEAGPDGQPVPVMAFDAYAMVISGFKNIPVSIFYIVAMALLCLHLTHGVSSMFQSLGLRNKVWRERLDKIAVAYGWVIFLGFISIPISIMTGAIS